MSHSYLGEQSNDRRRVLWLALGTLTALFACTELARDDSGIGSGGEDASSGMDGGNPKEDSGEGLASGGAMRTGGASMTGGSTATGGTASSPDATVPNDGGTGGADVDGAMVCPAGFVTCVEGGPACGTDLNTDVNHCGRCDLACGDSMTCENGLCQQPTLRLRLGQRDTCVLTPTQDSAYNLECAGVNDRLQLRDPAAGTARGQMAPLPGYPRVRDVAMSFYRACVIPEAGDQVDCWGGIAGADNFPIESQALQGVQTLEAGRFSFCGITEGHNLYCWGMNEKGQIGPPPGMPYDVYVPHFVEQISDVREVEIAAHSTCARDGAGHVTCWGTMGMTYGAGDVMDGSSLLVAKRIAGGGRETIDGYCAIRPDDTVVCWGANLAHRAGDSGAVLDAVPVGVSDAVDISLEAFSACAILKDGHITCWGREGFLEGAAVVGPFDLPYPAGHGLPQDIEMQNVHTCVRFEDGQILCRGFNIDGQLGSGVVSNEFSRQGWTAMKGYP